MKKFVVTILISGIISQLEVLAVNSFEAANEAVSDSTDIRVLTVERQ